MAPPHLTPFDGPVTPCASPTIKPRVSIRDRFAKGQSRPRRLTLPSTAAPRIESPTQSRRQLQVPQPSQDIDDLLPRLRTMCHESSLYTPQSSAFDSSCGSLPFVLDDGVLSFPTRPQTWHDNPLGYEPSLPSSALYPSFGIFPDESPHLTHKSIATFQSLVIWQDNKNGSEHIYTQAPDKYPAPSSISIGSLDPFMIRCDPVHAATRQFPCHFTHVDISLANPPPTTCDNIKSAITVSSPCKSPMRLLTAVYSQDVLLSSYETQMDQWGHPHFDAVSYSAPLPQQLINEVRKELTDSYRGTVPSGDVPSGKLMNSVFVMEFVQKVVDVEETVLVVAGKFRALGGPSPAEVDVSPLTLDEDPSQEVFIPETFLPTPPLSDERHDNHTHPSKFPRLARPIPKLSVSIPPPHMHGVRGIQLCTDSPGLTPDSSSMRPTPRTGVPVDAVFPVTPSEHLTYTPHRSTPASDDSASAYPFTLSSTTPGPAPSPAFGILDSAGPVGSAPPWLTPARNVTPFTPSLFMPHTTDAIMRRVACDDDDRSPAEVFYFGSSPLLGEHPDRTQWRSGAFPNSS